MRLLKVNKSKLLSFLCLVLLLLVSNVSSQEDVATMSSEEDLLNEDETEMIVDMTNEIDTPLINAVEIINDAENDAEDNVAFPPMFVMNLARSSDRWNAAQIQMSSEGLTVKRFDAIDGRALSYLELRNQSTRMAMYLQPRGVIGCYLSHRKFWQMVVDENYDSAIIFEDDVKLVHNFREKLAYHLKLFGDEKYDVVLLGERNYF